MAQIREDTQGKTRDLPITPELRSVLIAAAEASGVDLVRVTSGGQCPRGTCEKRTGSTRHDAGRAADLQLLVAGRTLRFTDQAQLKTFEHFVTEAARAGATGLGAGVQYMGDDTIHVGFGSRAVWGAGGTSSSAPDWLRRAALAGWGRGASPFAAEAEMMADADELPTFDSPDEEIEDDYR